MTDAPAPSPETPSASSTPPEPRPKRPWTILGRLTEAVREQNWFAVVLELAIVVLGVVIGFQVTAWGQGRADRATEQTYLRQLVADLSSTEREVSRIDDVERRNSGAAASLLHAFYQPEPPSADSLAALLQHAVYSDRPNPVMGTVEALVATGDLNLIRNDSLRAAITAYLQSTRDGLARQTQNQDNFDDGRERLAGRVDPSAQYAALPEAIVDSLARVWPLFLLPPGPRVALTPIDREAFLSDTEARDAIRQMLRAKDNLRRRRSDFGRQAEALRVQVEAELNR